MRTVHFLASSSTKAPSPQSHLGLEKGGLGGGGGHQSVEGGWEGGREEGREVVERYTMMKTYIQTVGWEWEF